MDHYLESDFTTRTVQRDSWTELETQFFLNRYNLYKTEIGKRKLFKNKKAMFNLIAEEMSDQLKCGKTGEQLSSRYYTLNRKLKKVNSDDNGLASSRETSVVGNLVRLDGTSVNDVNEPSTIVNMNDDVSIVDLSSTLITYTGEALLDSDSISDTNNTMLSEANETSNLDINESFDHAAGVGIGILPTSSRKSDQFPRIDLPSRIRDVDVGITAVYNTTSEDGSSYNCGSGVTSRNAIHATTNLVRPTIRISGGCSLAGLSNNADMSSTSSNASMRISRAVSLARLSNNAHTSSISSNAPMIISGVASLAGLSNNAHTSNTSSSAPLQNNVLDIARNSSIGGLSNEDWSIEETKWLLDQYYYYMDEVGPMKLYRTKKNMFEQLARVMSDVFGCHKTADDLSNRVNAVIKQKKDAVDRNRRSGASRINIAYEEEINKIAAADDSIEPEVLRGVDFVYYKESSKKTDKKEVKRPRWAKPNKKGILNTLSETLLAIEKRRTEREKSKEEKTKLKEERKRKMFDESMELIRSLKTREN